MKQNALSVSDRRKRTPILAPQAQLPGRRVPPQAQACFTPAGLRFLRGLARNNDRAPESIMMRIYRDTRFSSDKRPYKQHVAAWWVHDGLAKTSGAGFYLHVSGSQVEIAAGAFMPDTEQLLAIRRCLLEHHEDYRKLAHARAFRRLFPDDEGQRDTSEARLTRSPKGFPTEHPAADLFRQKRWGFSASLSSEMATKLDFAKTISQHFRAAAPLVALLNQPLVAKAQRPRRPLF
jgi:uncharacterized protein (TIGR02453 family)